MRFALTTAAMLGLLVPALAQAPPSDAPAGNPTQTAPDEIQKPDKAQEPDKAQDKAKDDKAASAKPPLIENMRIRGSIQRVDGQTLVVDLSKGLSVRVEIQDSTPILVASHMDLAKMPIGADLRIRTRSGTQGATVATEVMMLKGKIEALPGEDNVLSDISVEGALMSVETDEGEKVIMVSEKGGGKRRIEVGKETAFWRLEVASIDKIKPGMAMSVMIVREPNQPARASRVVVGKALTGAALPL